MCEPLGEQRAEVPVDLREAVAELRELVLRQHEQVERGRRPDGCRRRLTRQQRHLSHRPTGCDPAHVVLAAIGPGDEDGCGAREHDVDLVERVALGDDDAVTFVRAPFEVVEGT